MHIYNFHTYEIRNNNCLYTEIDPAVGNVVKTEKYDKERTAKIG